MSADRDNWVWPLVCILAGLFVFSVHVPRTEKRAKQMPPTAGLRLASRSAAGPAAPRWDGSVPLVPQLSAIPPLAQVPVKPIEQVVSLSQAVEAVRMPAVEPSGPAPALAQAAPALTSDPSIELIPAIPDAPVGMVAEEAPVAEEPPAVPTPRLTVDDLAATAWCEPVGLLAYLQVLGQEAQTRPWSQEVGQGLQELRTAMALQSDEAGEILQRLARLSDEAACAAEKLGEAPLAGELRRAQHALQRRVELWKSILVIGGMAATAGRQAEPDPAQLAQSLAEVDTMLGRIPGGDAWRRYLELRSLQSLTQPASDRSQPWLMAAEILRRLTRVSLTPQQQQVVYSAPVARLVAQLRFWAGEPVSIRQLMEELERYEQGGLSSDGRLLVADTIRLVSSPVAVERALGQQLDEQYSNANFRFSVTSGLANRMVPKRQPEMEAVNDRVLGTPVHGQSMTTSDVGFRFVPDPYRLRTALEIRGRVASETSSYSGPATFFNSSWSNFLARKEIELGLQGLTLGQAQVDVQNETRLRSVYTDFDPIPLVGSVAQEIARSQHEEKQPQVRAELEQKVAARVKRQIDEEADGRLGKLSDRMKDRLFRPLADMGLGPALVSAQTTEERMTMRLRLAAPMQLGAHTPRPRALGNSLASVQIHESALNNLLEQLQLCGQSLTVAEMRQRIAQRAHRPEMLEVTGENDDVTICLAAENGVQIRCDEGLLTLTLSVVSLAAPSANEQWENFEVETSYRPHLEGRRAEFTREGVIRLVGEGLSMRSQIALRGIFSKTFSKQRPLVLTPESMLEDPRLAGLGVTQMVLEDGWLSLAFGPCDAAAEPMVAQRPRGTE